MSTTSAGHRSTETAQTVSSAGRSLQYSPVVTELDEAEELDRDDVAELAADYARLRTILPDLRVVGGCCGTDQDYIAAIAAELTR